MKLVTPFLFALFQLAHLFGSPDKEEAMIKASISIYVEPISSGTVLGVSKTNTINAKVYGGTEEKPTILPIELAIGSNGNNFIYEGSSKFNLFDDKDTLISSCTLNPEWKSIFIVMLPNSDGKYFMRAVDTGKTSIGEGMAKIVNFSSFELASIVADNRIMTPSNGENIVSLDEVKSFEFRMMHAVKDQENTEWKLVISRNVNVKKKDRILVYVYRRFGSSGPWISQVIRNP